MRVARLKEWLAIDGCLIGRVYDEPALDEHAPGRPDGTIIATADIVEMNAKENWAMTKNCKYILENE